MADRKRWILILAVGVAAFAAGVLWHGPVRRLLGVHGSPVSGTGAPSQVWTCSMHPQVQKEGPGRCPICHMELVPLRAASAPAAATRQPDPFAERKIKLWWDPTVTPPYTSDQPGRSPSGTALVPLYEDEVAASPQVMIDPAMVQNLGVRTASVTEGPLLHTVRTVGTLEEAQPNIRDINLRVSGWVKKVYITSEGQHIEAGAPLFDLYSPDLQLAIQELIATRGAGASGDSTLGDAAARKLELLGLDRAQVEMLGKGEKAPDVITFKSPISGHITEKLIVEGAAVKSGDRVLRIVDHTKLWVDAQVFERDLPFVRIGAKASATVASRPRNQYDGQVIFIHPHVDMTTRAVVARLEVLNAGLALKPGMYATVRIESVVAERAVLMPREAIIDSGDSQIAIKALGGGRFEAQKVKVGLSADDGMIQVVAGLAASDQVVTSGQFLIDSESRLRESLQKFESMPVAVAPSGASEFKLPLPPAAPVALDSAQLAALDAATRAYLDIGDALGAPQKETKPISPEPLVAASKELLKVAAGTPIESSVTALVAAASAMQNKNIDQQREAFKSVSEKFITLVTAAPPSRGVGDKLHIMECPMAPGYWVQRSDELANPYYGTEMKECGSHSGVITTRETPK